jgi:hypothetical protein
MFVAVCMVPFVAGVASAQTQPWPDAPPQPQAQPQTPPWPDTQPQARPQAQPWPDAQSQAQSQAQQGPPCLAEFGKLRDDAEKKANVLRQASARKASPKEACNLLTGFSAAEAKMLKYASDNRVWCGIPPQIVESIKKGHERTAELRTKVCQVAAAPQAPRGPTLSDALGGPVPDASNIKTGRGGTFDTLSGTSLGR